MLTLCAANLNCGEHVAHAFFGRKGGVSKSIYAELNCGPGSSDERAHVIENRRRAAETLARGAKLVTLYQVHGRDAVQVRESWDIGQAPKADAMVTNESGIALGIRTADCAPVLLADAEARVIAASHAGWKGALAGIIESTVEKMEQLGARRDHVAATVGPCISQTSYEVGDELRAAVDVANPADARLFVPSKRAGHWHFNLGGYVQIQLERAGIQNIFAVPVCTYRQEHAFFSYRRATHRGEPDYGRQLSAIALL